MHYQQILFRQLPLQERQAFDVADGTADLGDHNIIISGLAQFCHPAFYFVGNMGDHLDCFSKISSFSFFGNYGLINAACGYIVCLGGVDIQKTFVVAKIEISFCSVFCNIAFAMLIRI